MKILLTLFVLLFSSSVVAEDISDFQIEGMSVGDSLLDYFSEQQIINNNKNYTFTNNMYIMMLSSDKNSQINIKKFDLN